jgi:hypothetical protein
MADQPDAGLCHHSDAVVLKQVQRRWDQLLLDPAEPWVVLSIQAVLQHDALKEWTLTSPSSTR